MFASAHLGATPIQVFPKHAEMPGQMPVQHCSLLHIRPVPRHSCEEAKEKRIEKRRA